MDQACEQALAGVGSAGAVGSLAFDCVARQRILDTDQQGEVTAGGSTGAGGLRQEAARFAVHAGGVPSVGCTQPGRSLGCRG